MGVPDRFSMIGYDKRSYCGLNAGMHIIDNWTLDQWAKQKASSRLCEPELAVGVSKTLLEIVIHLEQCSGNQKSWPNLC